MAMGPERWKVITPSEFSWEQEAFDYLRANLPDADPYLAWQGFNFITDTGGIYEVDALILTPVGFFLVEVKSNRGALDGDAASWTWKHEGRQQTVDNPLLLASSKARKLAGRLKAQKAFKDIRCPFLEPLIFVSAQGLQIELPEHARTRVCPRDRAATPEREGRPGILAALIDGNIPNVDASRTPRIDRATMGAVSRAMEQAGIRQSEKYLRISDYKLKSLLMEGPGWQDWEGVHVSLADNRRRIRRYTLAAAAGTEQREMLLRAAKREYQVLDTLSHRGILGVKGYTDNEFGPALIFEHHPKAVRLDHYLSRPAAKLGVDARLSLVRQAAEAMKYAHGKGVYHRALAPQSILVTDPSAATPEIKIFNWQTAAREIASGSGNTNAPGKGVTATVHVERLVEDASTAYMAPEAMGDGEAGEHLDVFSLGALTYHVFAERPPATSYVELHEKIRASNGLQISAAMDAAPETLQTLIQFATFPEVSSRYGTVDDFLDQLEDVEEELSRPEQEQTVHPLDAKINDRLEGGLEVRSRIGTGSTSHVLLVDDHGTERVLKIARGPEYNARLADEAEVLKKIRHQYVVEVHKPVQIHGLSGILMQRAGTQTLAHRLKEEGKLHPDLLQQFGDDLLQTVDWLEQAGIPHRDLKPDNIGVTPVGRGNQLHLVLFDFSLSRTSADNIRAGTPRYMDPFLSLRRPTRWDLAAERWSAAATLYEMATGPATGELLKWGDGKTAPAMLDCEATIDAEKFDAEVRDGLLSFFGRAFRRDPAERFDNAQDMLKAWREAFAAGAAGGREARGHAEVSEAEAAAAITAAIAAATLDTPVVALGLGSRAITALDRLGVNNVRDLLRVPPRRVYRMRSVGQKTRRHLGVALGKLRARFPDVQPDAAAGETSTGATGIGEPEAVVGSVEQLLKTITGGAPTGKHDLETRAVRAYLNLDRLDTPARGHWPTQTEVAAEMKVGKARVNQWIDNARRRWLKNKNLTRLRDELLEILHGEGGVMTAAELAGAVLATRGSILEEPQRSRIASAVVRAAVEADRALAVPRFGVRRRGTLNLVARAYDEDDPAALCDYAMRLGDEADGLAKAEPLPTPQRAIESLRGVKAPALPPTATPAPMDDSRLLALAAGASTSAAVSSRLEIYPRGMSADRALKLGIGALSASPEVTLERIRERVHGRYPEAQPLPDRPELDRLLKDAGWTLSWDDARQAYVVPTELFATHSYTSTLPRYATGHAGAPQAVTPEVAEARDFDDRLRRSLQTGGFLALSVAPRYVRRAADNLTDRFGPDEHSLDDLLIGEMKKQAAARKVDWAVVLEADAGGPAGRDWPKLMLLVKAAVAEVEKQVLSMSRPVLLLCPGLVARYEQLQLLDHLREGSGRAGNVPGIWLLVSASDHQNALPMIDNRPVPVLGHGHWAWVPEGWLTNGHRGQAALAV